MVTKREDYISWDEYFMGVSILSGMRSKDPNTQVGACIVSEDHRILSMGYNGMPTGCSDDELPWDRTADDPLDTKYLYVCHAELNAILNHAGPSLRGARPSKIVKLPSVARRAKLKQLSGLRNCVLLLFLATFRFDASLWAGGPRGACAPAAREGPRPRPSFHSVPEQGLCWAENERIGIDENERYGWVMR